MTPQPHPEGATVCVVEDDPGVRDLFRLMLESRGYRCISHSDGETALERMRVELPVLIVLDLALPGKNGMELLADLRQDDLLGKLPVIVVTGLTEETPGSEEQWRRRLEVEAFFSKPLEPARLLETVEQLLADDSRGA